MIRRTTAARWASVSANAVGARGLGDDADAEDDDAAVDGDASGGRLDGTTTTTIWAG
jgi:hypothetical protein